MLAMGVAPADFAKADHGRGEPTADPQAVRAVQGSVRAHAAGLQQLGIPEGRVQAFYRPFQPNPEEPKEPCEVCGGIGYFGRTAVFEMLAVGDAVRKALAAEPKDRRAPSGRPQGRHEKPPGRRRLAGGQGRDFAAGVDESVETISG